MLRIRLYCILSVMRPFSRGFAATRTSEQANAVTTPEQVNKSRTVVVVSARILPPTVRLLRYLRR